MAREEQWMEDEKFKATQIQFKGGKCEKKRKKGKNFPFFPPEKRTNLGVRFTI
jgi:hypothetical protein